MRPSTFIFIGMLLFLLSCEVQEAPNFDPALYSETELEIAKDVVIWYTDSARLKAKITGAEMRRSVDGSNPYDEFDGGVVVDFYEKTGESKSHLLSEYVLRYERKGMVIAKDAEGVILTNDNGDSLISSELIWLDKEDKITTDKFVYIRTADRKIWGQGFESNMEFTKGRIKAVEGELSVDELTEKKE